MTRDELERILERVSGVDEGTVGVIEALCGRLPVAALHTAYESLEARRRREPRLQSEAGYFVAALKMMQAEERYA